MAQPTSMGQKILSLALFETRVNASDMAIFSFLAFMLAFTLATIKDGRVLDFSVLVGWAISKAPAQNL